MPRNSSGTMTLTTPGVPFQSGQTISSSQVNTTFADLAAELTDSLSRSAKGGLLAVLRGVDGTVAAPAFAFTSETGTGWYKAAAGELRLAIAGVDLISFKNNTITLLIAGNPIIAATGANSALSIVGNKAAADAGTDASIASTATRTAGDLLQIQNGGSLSNGGLGVDYHGLLRLGAQAAAIQPASIYNAPTPDANWTAAYGLAYWKDVCGLVRFKGAATNNTGGLSSGILSTTPLPAGFRPAAATFREFGLPTSAGTVVIGSVSAAGVVTLTANVANGVTVWLDPIAFSAEA